MAPAPGTLRVGRYFLALAAILAVLYAIVFIPGHKHTPKLGIDLVGGIRVIFKAVPPPGSQITSSAMEQARQIIEDRINGTGVTTSTVQIQGTDQLVVSIPGGTGTDVSKLGKAAQLNFRPLIAPVQQVTCNPKLKPQTGTGSAGASANPSANPSTNPSATPTTKPSSGASSPAKAASSSSTKNPNSVRERPLAAPSPSGSATSPAATSPAATSPAATSPAKSGATTPAPSASTPTKAPACIKDPIKLLQQSDKSFKLPTTEAQYSKLGQQQQQELTAVLQNYDCNSAIDEPDVATSGYIACQGGQLAYLLGSVIVPGRQIDDASAVAPSTGSGQGGSTNWTVALKLKGAGDAAWGKWTTAHNTNKSDSANYQQCGSQAAFPCSDFVAFTLDGNVVSAPATNEPINGGTTQISGADFTQKSTNDLANQLKYGALPLSFRTDSNEQVSASLGTSQLKAAFLAGGIGLVLVVIYSLLYYRALGFVTIASLLVSGGLTYAMLVLLGSQIGFTLDLSGIAGFIVALGITADSFVVFFERIKDEVHDGRSLRVAIPRAWVRARRTILSADTVSFLAAAILYFFASADVKGFAFTLGMSTILDLVVVFLFTHPIVSLLSRSRAFGSPRFTGLNAVRTGGIVADTPTGHDKLASTRRSGAKRTGAAQSRPTTARTAVIDDTADETDLDPAEDATTDEPTSVDVTKDEPAAPTGPSEQPGERRRTAPQGGTAAERAAARRARQQNKDDDGNGES